jgi:hypothetical protein
MTNGENVGPSNEQWKSMMRDASVPDEGFVPETEKTQSRVRSALGTTARFLILLVSLVVTFAIGSQFLVASAIVWCGVSGCGGGGFGVARNPGGTILLLAVGSAIAASPLVFVPWVRWRIRIPVGVIVFLLVGTLAFLYVLRGAGELPA